MLQTIFHRGPDAQGQIIDEKIGLYAGMRRLSIIDLKGGDQPIWNEDESIAVLFNGEIYNYTELRADLLVKGHNFRTQSDTEVLVHLYEELHIDMVQKLRGMFTFAIFDRQKRKIILARDHFGQKPLYLYEDKETLAFASELKAFFSVPFCNLEIRRERLIDYMIWHSLPPPETHFTNVRKIRAGEILEISIPWESKSSVSTQRYWSIDYSKEPIIKSEEEGIAKVDEALKDSIRHHLRADVPVGVMLSSGLDSKMILAYAKRFTPELATFTVGFSGNGSENTQAEIAARRFAARHHSVTITAQTFYERLPEVAWHLDEPVCDPACSAFLLLCREARNHVKVLLSGEGADELFAGYDQRYLGRLKTLAKSRKLQSLLRCVPGLKRHEYPIGKWQRGRHRAASTRAEESVDLTIAGFPSNPKELLGFDRTQLNYTLSRATTLANDLYRPQPDDLSSLLALDTDWELPEVLLQKADKMSMAASLELRTPFLDVPLSNVATAISSQLKLPHSGPGKYILRKALIKNTELSDFYTPKKGFPMPLHQWLSEDLRDRIESSLFGSNVTWDTILDRPLVRTAWDQFIKGDASLSRPFYALVLYETWSQQFTPV